MKGFDYEAGKPVNWSIPQWKTKAREAIRKGGFVREDPKLGETFIHRVDREGNVLRPKLVAEVYGVNLKLKETTNG